MHLKILLSKHEYILEFLALHTWHLAAVMSTEVKGAMCSMDNDVACEHSYLAHVKNVM